MPYNECRRSVPRITGRARGCQSQPHPFLHLREAAAIPMARFQLLPDTGHSPQQETPDQVIHAIWNSADTDFSAFVR
jgi:pimeloyl-ACP methyl ester carboxylesterase